MTAAYRLALWRWPAFTASARLAPTEALDGVTKWAAQALGRAVPMGALMPGKYANFLVWDVANPAEIVCHLGVTPLVERVFRGRVENVHP